MVVRLAWFKLPAIDKSIRKRESIVDNSMSQFSVKLAHVPGAQGDGVLMGRNGVKKLEHESAPALLVAYPFLNDFLKSRSDYVMRDWVLDSGAFSAFNSGMVIDVQEYIETCKRLLRDDDKLVEVFALDVIGDWKAGLKNTEIMWKAGVPAIPCYHYGEPEHVLKTIAREYPKIALGGVARKNGVIKMKFAEQCFARVWPKKIHGFGYGSEKQIMAFPWHSVDATNWELGPCAFGRWNVYGKMSVRGSNQNLRAEIEYYLRLEKRANERWKRELEKLENAELQLRLAVKHGESGRHAYLKGGKQ